MKKFFYCQICGFTVILLLSGCTFAKQETGTEFLTIASWNVQNLFDGEDNGYEYDEFKNSSGWNAEKYQGRLQSITAALQGESGIQADILALIEIENETVVRDLADESYLGYGWSFFAGAADASVGLGVLSALPITEARAHSFHGGDGSIPRPVAEVWVDTGSGPLVLLVCHWKSKTGGEKKTESLRQAGSALIVRLLAEIEAEREGTPVIVMGDLNENYDEFSRVGAAYPCALLPGTDEAAALVQKKDTGIRLSARPGFQDFLVLCGEKPLKLNAEPGTFSALSIVYSPWFELEETPTGNQNSMGSYYYKDAWETIDHFLLNGALFGENGLRYESFRVLSESPFTNAAGIPNSYNPRTGNGLSDHLPIVLVLNKGAYR